MAENTVKLAFGAPGETAQVFVKPGDNMVFDNIDLDAIEIDILGPDVIFSDPTTGAKIFLPGLGLILFSPEDAPTLTGPNGTSISPQDILSRVGIIQNVTQEDFLTFTSLDINPQQGSENLNLTGLAESTDNDELQAQIEEQQQQLEQQQQQIEEQTEQFFDIASKLNDFTSDLDGYNSSKPATPEEDSTTPNNDTTESINSSRADFVEDATGALTQPPAQPASPGTPETEIGITDPVELVIEVPTAANAVSSISLLQLAATDNLDAGSLEDATRAADVFFGGGSSESGAFDTSSDSQFSRETIDTTAETDNHTIYADDNQYIDTTNMARALKISPALSVGFDVDDMTISGIPNDFTVYLSGSTVAETPDGSGNYTFTSADLDSSNNLNLVLQYPTATTANFFLIEAAIESSFTFPAGVDVPSETSETENIELKAQVKTVNTPADGDVTDTLGLFDWDGSGVADADDIDLNDDSVADTIYVFSNTANENRIITSDANVTIYGGESTDTVTAGAGNDFIYVSGGDDTVVAGDGDDLVRGGDGNDTLNGGNGTDTVDFSDMTDGVTVTLNGTSTVSATIGADTDTISGFENIIGGAGNDVFTGDTNTNDIDGGSGDDTITASAGDDDLDGGADTDTLDYASYTNINLTIDLADGSTVSVSGDTHTITGFENVTTGTGDDIITGTIADNIINASSGDNNITGGAGNDTITTGDDSDTVDGGADTDTISTGDGADDITGGNGNDIINAGAGDDTITEEESGTDQITGGTGTDQVSYRSFTSGITIDLTSDAGGAYTGFSEVSSSGASDYITEIEQILGTDFVDNMTGDTNDNLLYGYDGGDTINGGDGDDTIRGGLGSDTLDGGNNTDTLDFSDLGGIIAITDLDLNSGTQTATASNADVDTISNFENFILTGFDDTITAGNASYDIDGGGGTDTIDFSNASTNLTVDLNQTTNSVTGYGTYDLSNIEDFVGGSGDDTISGEDGVDNDLDGGTGTNTLDYTYETSSTIIDLDVGTVTIGGETDTVTNFQNLYGGSGVDDFFGDAGDNVFDGNNGADDIEASFGNDTYDGDNGNDILRYGNARFDAESITVDLSNTSFSDSTLGAGFSQLTLNTSGDIHLIKSIYEIAGTNNTSTGDNITGSSAAEYLRGNNGGDTLNGGGGNDILEGGAGADTINGGTGNDTIQGGSDNDIIDGGDDNDDITGDDGVDTITGGSGNDTIRGGGTAGDNINGEAGNDTLYANNSGGDTITGGADTDTVNYSEVTNGAGVDVGIDITLSGGGGVDSQGNTLSTIENITGSNDDDNITGDAGANILSGGSGIDDLNGGDGADTLNGGNDSDTLNGGNDGDTLNGDAGADILNGDAGNDTLNGGNGTDTLYGGAGNDAINGDGGTDDTANYSSAAGAINVDLEAGTTTAGGDGDGGTDTFSGVENVTGSGGDDTIKGDSVANSLQGGAGNDRFIGSENDDTIDGGTDTTGDTMDYSGYFTDYGETIDITLNDTAGSATVSTSGGHSQTLSNIEDILGTSSDDTFNVNFNSIDSFSSVDGDSGTDTIVYTDSVLSESIDGDDFATYFTDVEEIDFSSTDTQGATFEITGDDIAALTGASNGTTLTLDGIDSAFGINLSAAGTYEDVSASYSHATGSTVYTFTDTDGSGDSVSLEVVGV